MNTVSVMILTHNSSKKIRDCLESVRWATEIVVLDDCSTDDTVAIAREYTPKVFIRKWDIEGRHRNFGYAQASGDYILSLDSDERVSPELRDEILLHMKEGFKFDCYNIPHRNYIGDTWIRHGGWYPNAKLKLFKRQQPVYEETEPHPRMLILGERYTLQGAIIHLAYDDFTHVIAKLDDQTTREAKKWVSDKRRVTLFNTIRKSLDRFFRAYFSKKGCKDGVIGLFLAVNGGMYQFLTFAKYWELKRNQKPNAG